ncbi:four helix bundle protein [Candidatus Gracilibacteria bacterium]|nr:four helix bundle protein [Candidatus Gracilibacteria bacterium]
MARYEHLPVFRDGYELVLRIFRFAGGLAKAHKYSIGEMLRLESLKILQSIVAANSEHVGEKRIAFLSEALLAIETVRILMRTVHDLQGCTTTQFAYIAESVESVSKQLAGWHRSMPGKMEARRGPES